MPAIRPLAALAALLLVPFLALAALPSAQDDPSDHAAWRERIPDDGRSLYLEDVSGNDCLRCHEAVGEEWRHSMHALAWQDEVYQAELKTIRRKPSCWSCHIPGPLDGTDRLEAPPHRSEHRHLGIDCVACHLAADGETILGPEGRPTDAHPTRASDLFETSNGRSTLCIGCHDESIGPVIGIAQDYVDTDQHELDHSCVSCHMPGLVRPSANAEDGTPLEARRVRSHRLESPRDPLFLRSAFRLTARVQGDTTVLRIENTTGHRVPGLVDRRISFVARLMDDSGQELGRGELALDHRSYLPVEESVELPIPGQGVRIEVEGFHRPPTLEEPFSFGTWTVEP